MRCYRKSRSACHSKSFNTGIPVPSYRFPHSLQKHLIAQSEGMMQPSSELIQDISCKIHRGIERCNAAGAIPRFPGATTNHLPYSVDSVVRRSELDRRLWLRFATNTIAPHLGLDVPGGSPIGSAIGSGLSSINGCRSAGQIVLTSLKSLSSLTSYD